MSDSLSKPCFGSIPVDASLSRKMVNRDMNGFPVKKCSAFQFFKKRVRMFSTHGLGDDAKAYLIDVRISGSLCLCLCVVRVILQVQWSDIGTLYLFLNRKWTKCECMALHKHRL